MLSNKTKYAIKALVALARNKEPMTILQIAEKEIIPKKFLEAILLELRKAGILNSKKGKGGGYVLARAPQDISVGDIIRTLDGSFSEIFFESDNKEINEIKIIMKEVRDAMSNILDKTSLGEVIERACNGQNVLNYVI